MKVNYKSDFSLVIQLTAGGEAVAVPTWDWSMIFYTCDRQAVYQCSRIGGVCDRCKVNADGTVTVYFDKHGLRPGAMVCEFCNHIPDDNFSFDKRITFDPVTLDVELVRGAGDEGMTPVELELAGDLLAQLQAIIEGLDVATDYVVNLSALWNDEENCFVAPPLPSGQGLPSWATIHHDALAALAEGRVVRYKVALLVDVSDVGYRVHDFAVASYNATAPTSVIKAVGYEDDTDNATPELFSLYHDESGVRVYSRDVATLNAVEEAVEPLQPRLTAGTGIDITNNVISAAIPDGAYIIDVDLDAEPLTTTAVFADALAAFESGRQVWFAGTSGGDLVFSVPVTLNYGGAILAGITWIDNEQQIFSFTANGVIYGQVTFVNTTALATALAGKQDVLTFDNVPTQASNNPVKSGGVYDAFSTYCPIIEDTRTGAVAAITGVAPFASLENGQRILLKLNFNTSNNTTLDLTLGDGTTTGAKGVWGGSPNVGALSKVAESRYKAGQYVELVWDDANDRWMCTDSYGNYPSTMKQADITNSTITYRLASGKLLTDNFDKVTTLVEVTATGDVTQALDSGKFYRFGSVDSLTLTFTAPSAGMGMWGGKFTASASWSALGIPATIDEAAGNDSIAGGKTYEFNVLDGIIVIKEV